MRMHVHSLCVFRLGFIRNSQSKERVSCNYNIYTFLMDFFYIFGFILLFIYTYGMPSFVEIGGHAHFLC